MLVRPYNDNLAVSPDNAVNFVPYATKGLLTSALYVGGAGSVVAVDENGEATTFVAVPVGTFLPIAVKRVNATGTTATNLVACYWV